jgi:hypothetical protein
MKSQYNLVEATSSNPTDKAFEMAKSIGIKPDTDLTASSGAFLAVLTKYDNPVACYLLYADVGNDYFEKDNKQFCSVHFKVYLDENCILPSDMEIRTHAIPLLRDWLVKLFIQEAASEASPLGYTHDINTFYPCIVKDSDSILTKAFSLIDFTIINHTLSALGYKTD